MSVYSYLFRRKKYFYFKVRFKDKQYSRRIDEFGDRYETVREAMFAESRFVKSLDDKKVKRNKIYIYQLYDEFVEYLSRSYKSTTVSSIVTSFKAHIFSIVKDLSLKEFNLEVVKEINQYISSLQFYSKNHIIAGAKNLIKFLNSYGVNLSCDLIQGGKNPNFRSDRITRFWTFEEFSKFISFVDDNFYKLLFSVLYYYGLRISELRGITKDCFTEYKLFIKKCLTNHSLGGGQSIVSTKTSSSVRSFDMFPFIYEMYLKLPPSKNEYVFSSLKGKTISIGESSIRRNLKYYCIKSGVKYIKLHEFRHSCASLLINNGMDSLQVANWLGHSNPGITLSTYSHLFNNRKNDVYNFLNDRGTKKRTL